MAQPASVVRANGLNQVSGLPGRWVKGLDGFSRGYAKWLVYSGLKQTNTRSCPVNERA